MAEKIVVEPIEEDMKQSYLDYAMSVIVGRAIPDVRDGLKPVHRRIIFSMYELGNFSNKPYKKSARVVGECLGKYHPHGDAAIYDALIRMAQDFSLRYPLIDGQGNLGSIDGDSPAAMRYTEVRLGKIAEELFRDIEKETVDFLPNFDATLKEPSILPSRIPNLLINGSSGIAVGMATNIPPHNLSEIVDALIAMIDGKSEDEVVSLVSGPDFPTGAIIVGRKGIEEAYKTGKGKIRVRAKCEIDKEKGMIKITEIPYQVSKSAIIESIASEVKKKRIDEIRGIHDRSDKRGLLIEVELKKGEDPNIVLRKLYAYTPLEITFGIINLVLSSGMPKIATLYELLFEFLQFRKEIVRKRSEYDLRVAEEKEHILKGLLIALDNVDRVVEILRASKDVKSASEALTAEFGLSEKQAKAILEMKMSKLVNLEHENLKSQYDEVLEKIRELRKILSDEMEILNVIKKELVEIRAKFGDERRTEIVDAEDEGEIESLIKDIEVAIMLTENGYVKRMPLEEYRTQNRGGQGVRVSSGEDDEIKDISICRNKDYLLFFTSKGRVFWKKAYQIPSYGRYSKGKAIVNILNTVEGEKVESIINVREFSDKEYLFFCTKNGTVKRTALSAFSHPRKGGIKAILLDDGDELVRVLRTNGEEDILISTANGLSVRFRETDVRPMGRSARGVRGIQLKKGDWVVDCSKATRGYILTVCENGYGKKTRVDDYRIQKRGGSGIINIKTTERNGRVVASKNVLEDDEVLLVSSMGKAIRTMVKDISTIGRNTQGVKIMSLKEGDKIKTVRIISSSGLVDQG